MGNEPDPLDIPAFLKRDINNKSEFMKMADSSVSEATETPRKAKTTVKANGAAKPTAKAASKAPVKAAGKPKAAAGAKAAPKAKTAPKVTAKAGKGSEKPKAAKPKTETKAKAASTVEKDAYGFRKGSAKSKAVALYARKNGATLEEVKEAVGSIQLNVLNGLEAEGHTVERTKVKRDGQRPLTRYILKPKA